MQTLKLKRWRYKVLTLALCWHTGGFETYDLFRRKFNKHVIRQGEFGAISEWRYLLKADMLFGMKTCPANHLGPPNCNVENCTRRHDGACLRYNNARNELGIKHGRYLATFFRPMKPPVMGRGFFLGECLR